LSGWFQRTVKKEDLGLSKENENYQKITKSLLSIIDNIENEKMKSSSNSFDKDKSVGTSTEEEKKKDKIKNIIDNSKIDAAGNVRIGDKNIKSDGDHTKKNVVKDSEIKSGGDLILGDENHK